MSETEQIIQDEQEDANELRDAEWAAKREAGRLKQRPDISHLPDAVVDGEFLVGVGKKLVIERVCSSLASKTWLDTKTYEVKSYDGVTGELDLYDDETNRRVLMNVKTCAELGYTLKQAHVKVGKVHRIRLTKGERVERRRLDAEARQERASKKREMKKKTPGLRRLYASDGLLSLLYKGTSYIAPSDTQITQNDLVQVSVRDEGRVTVKTQKFEEIWLRKVQV